MKACKKSCRKNGPAKVNAQTQKELNTLPVSTAKTTGAQYAGKQKAPGKNVTKKGIRDFFQNKGLASALAGPHANLVSLGAKETSGLWISSWP